MRLTPEEMKALGVKESEDKVSKTVKVDFEALSSELLCMSDLQAGKFLRLLCMQAGMGAVPEESMTAIARNDAVVRAMFRRTEKGYQNVRLAEAMLQSEAFSESRSENRKEKAEKPQKLKYGEFVEMTTKEFETLADLYGRTAADKMVEVLDNYKGSSGKKYKSDYRAILTWVVKKVEQEFPGLIVRGKGAYANPDENPFS